jgi:uncharacterized protein YbjT (DUF2867 family)
MADSAAGTALIAGATGLVGRACLRCLLDHPALDRVIALARRPLPFAHPKLQVEIVDYDAPEKMPPVAAGMAFCALGTTLARAGSKEAFRAVDYRAVLAVADLALQSGARRFVLVSSVGADPASRNFYLSVKGEAEAAVNKRAFRAVHVLRPGLLLGDRQESRPAEALFRALAPITNPLMVGRLRMYRAIDAAVVGAAMVGAAFSPEEGRRVLHYDAILRLARQVPGPQADEAGPGPRPRRG